MKEQVILVDQHDNEVGIEEKMQAHRDGKLHRAFSVFVFALFLDLNIVIWNLFEICYLMLKFGARNLSASSLSEP